MRHAPETVQVPKIRFQSISVVYTQESCHHSPFQVTRITISSPGLALTLEVNSDDPKIPEVAAK